MIITVEKLRILSLQSVLQSRSMHCIDFLFINCSEMLVTRKI